MNKKEIKEEAIALINDIESLKVYCEVAMKNALELRDKCESEMIDYKTLPRPNGASALVGLAVLCQGTAVKVNYAIDLAIKFAH